MPRRDQQRTTGRADERVLAVYDGQALLGSVSGCAGKYVAHDVRRRLIGKFATVRTAANAICKRCSESAE
jgi:hypothetical protein